MGLGLRFIGSLLPWATVTVFAATLSKNGTDGDGVLTLIASLVVAALMVPVLWARARKGLVVAALLVACLLTFIAGFDVVNVSRRVADINDSSIASASVGYGLWITLVGGMVTIAGTATTLTAIRRRWCPQGTAQ